jgi:hypothetical protein
MKEPYIEGVATLTPAEHTGMGEAQLTTGAGGHPSRCFPAGARLSPSPGATPFYGGTGAARGFVSDATPNLAFCRGSNSQGLAGATQWDDTKRASAI